MSFEVRKEAGLERKRKRRGRVKEGQVPWARMPSTLGSDALHPARVNPAPGSFRGEASGGRECFPELAPAAWRLPRCPRPLALPLLVLNSGEARYQGCVF